jgi:hypothetical protein
MIIGKRLVLGYEPGGRSLLRWKACTAQRAA